MDLEQIQNGSERQRTIGTVEIDLERFREIQNGFTVILLPTSEPTDCDFGCLMLPMSPRE